MLWLSRSLYESIPYLYFAAGLLALVASLNVPYGYWTAICAGVGVVSLIAGLAVWLKRRTYRRSNGE
jgi:hypothetical protein